MSDYSNSNEIRTLFISDEAYTNLWQLAHIAGFVSNAPVSNEYRAKGISNYIADVLTSPNRDRLIDTRPEDVKATDTDLVTAGYTREWRKYTPRRARRIKVTVTTLINACDAAYKLGISCAGHRLKGAPDVFDGVQCTSMLLEALGTGWVTLQDE